MGKITPLSCGWEKLNPLFSSLPCYEILVLLPTEAESPLHLRRWLRSMRPPLLSTFRCRRRSRKQIKDTIIFIRFSRLSRILAGCALCLSSGSGLLWSSSGRGRVVVDVVNSGRQTVPATRQWYQCSTLLKTLCHEKNHLRPKHADETRRSPAYTP